MYSVGMILGVLLTGRDPTDTFLSGEAGRGGLGIDGCGICSNLRIQKEYWTLAS
jgi:hypothetical protein